MLLFKVDPKRIHVAEIGENGSQLCHFCRDVLECNHFATERCENVPHSRRKKIKGWSREDVLYCPMCCRCVECTKRVDSWYNTPVARLTKTNPSTADLGEDYDYDNDMAPVTYEYSREELIGCYPCGMTTYMSVLHDEQSESTINIVCGLEHVDEDDNFSRYYAPRIRLFVPGVEGTEDLPDITSVWPTSANQYFKTTSQFCSVLKVNINFDDEPEQALFVCDCCCCREQEGEELRGALEEFMSSLMIAPVRNRKDLNDRAADRVRVCCVLLNCSFVLINSIFIQLFGRGLLAAERGADMQVLDCIHITAIRQLIQDNAKCVSKANMLEDVGDTFSPSATSNQIYILNDNTVAETLSSTTLGGAVDLTLFVNTDSRHTTFSSEVVQTKRGGTRCSRHGKNNCECRIAVRQLGIHENDDDCALDDDDDDNMDLDADYNPRPVSYKPRPIKFGDNNIFGRGYFNALNVMEWPERLIPSVNCTCILDENGEKMTPCICRERCSECNSFWGGDEALKLWGEISIHSLPINLLLVQCTHGLVPM